MANQLRRTPDVAQALNSLKGAWLLAVMLLLLTAAAAVFFHERKAHENQQEVVRRFERLRERVIEELNVRMRQYEYGLRGTRGAVAAAGDGLSRAAFARYAESRDFSVEFPGALGLGFIRRVSPQQREAFVQRMRAENMSLLEINTLQSHDGDQYVIEYIQPLERNLAALGLDIASDPVRNAAAQQSRDTAQAALTAPITLLQDPASPTAGLLLMLPVYQFGAMVNTPEQRRAALVGWVYAPLKVSEVLRELDVDAQYFVLHIRDQQSPQGQMLYSSGGQGGVYDAAVQETRLLALFGRHWEIDLQPTPEFVASLNQRAPSNDAAMASALGIVGTALLLAILQLMHRGRAQRLEQSRRAAIVQGSDDAIIVQTLSGRVTDWNDGARRLFGFEAFEALGRTAQEILVPSGLSAEDEYMLAEVSSGRRVKAFETVRRHKDGSLVEVSISAAPITDARGRVVGLAKSLRDVRDARAAERKVRELNASLEGQVRARTADLEAARHALQTVLDAMPSQIGYWGQDLRNQVANRAYGDWFQLTAEQVHGMHLRDLLGARLFETSRPHIEAALRGESSVFEETRDNAGPNGARHSLVHYLPDVQDGEVKGFYAFVHDVTELTESRLQLAAAQRDNAALLQTLRSHAIVSVADRAGRIVEVNDAFCAISGYSREELLGQNHRIVNSGTHPRQFWESMWQDISQGRGWRGEVCNRAKDGSLYWVYSVVAPFLDAGGRVEKYVSIRTDITDRKRAQLELQRTLTLLRTVLDASTQVAIVATDTEGVVTVFNKGAERLMGYASEEVIARMPAASFVEAMLEGDATPAQRWMVDPAGSSEDAKGDSMERLLALSQDARYQWFLVHRDGTRIPVALAVTSMLDEQGQFIGHLGMASDMSARLAQQQSLREAVQQAEDANEAKSRFLANMSHEIRTPMNAVIGLSYLLAQTSLNEDQQGMLQRLQVAGKALLAVINDVLDFSKIEAGEMALEIVPVDMGEIAREVSALIDLQVRSKGIAYVLDLPPSLPFLLEGDSTRLHQVLINLLTNAVKFTEHGSVRLLVRYELQGDDRVDVRLEVHDTGIGISREAQQRLFSPFVQADVSTTRRYGGSGLGLSIVKQLVEMMGGHIAVHSALGQGSRFVVSLPMRRCDGVPALAVADGSQPVKARLAGIRLLVVDDNDVNQEVAARILQGEGAQVSVAPQGKAALALLQQAHAFDAVLMDVHMPVMDGLEATRRIRCMPGLEHLPVIGLTAGVSPSEQTQGLQAGMNVIVGKPIDPPALIRMLCRSLVESGALRAEAGSGASHAAALAQAGASALPEDWPRWPGLSAQRSFVQLQGHAPLLHQLARRIRTSLSALEQGVRAPDACAAPAEVARQLHDLKGMAGTMAADALQQLAARAEEMLRQESGWPAETAQRDLAAMRKLVNAWPAEVPPLPSVVAANAVPASAEGPQGDAEWGLAGLAGVGTVAPALLVQLRELRDLLAANDFSAMERFAELAPALRAWWGSAFQDAMVQHMDNLDFTRAIDLLDTHVPPSAFSVR